MNWAQFEAMLFLHWCLLRNRIRKAGIGAGALTVVLLILGSVAVLGMFSLALTVGVKALPRATPPLLMLVWVGIAGGFLFFWMLGLLMTLQRSEGMSLTRFLHLPSPLGWVLVYNYLCSWFSLSMLFFFPAMLGLSVAQVVVHGPALLISIPLVLAFIAMITALSYQFQGWLERLMRNKRRRQYVIAGLTLAFVALVQLPNLFNLATRGDRDRRPDGELGALLDERDALRQELDTFLEESKKGATPPPEETREAEQKMERIQEIEKEKKRLKKEEKAHVLARIDEVAAPLARWIPLGWLPYGMRSAQERRLLAPLLCILGMAGIAAWSLRRSYRSTLAFITGNTTRHGVAATPAKPEERREAKHSRKPLLVEKDLPWMSEGQAAVSLTALQSMIRMPELKILLLSPVLLIAFGIYGIWGRREFLQPHTPFLGMGAITMSLFCLIQIIQNQFGLDRDGFRAYVLCPVPRHEILRAKNLAAAPAALGFGAIALVLLQVLVPMDLVHFLAAWLQLLTAYLILCMLGNSISIAAPIRLRENSMRATRVTAGIVLLQLACVILFPLALSPLLVPFAGEALADSLGIPAGGLVYLGLNLVLLATMGWVYLLVTRGQGEMLQREEQKILDTLTRQ